MNFAAQPGSPSAPALQAYRRDSSTGRDVFPSAQSTSSTPHSDESRCYAFRSGAKIFLSRKLIERHPANARHDFTERDETDIAVGETDARRITQWFFNQSLDGFVVAGPTLAQIEVGRIAGACVSRCSIVMRSLPSPFSSGM